MITQFDGVNRWLSNFAPAPVQYEGVTYPTVEHAYQAAKVANPANREFFLTGTPGNAKQMGKSFKKREGWEGMRLTVMYDLLKQKFSIPEYREKLLSTGHQELIEGNLWGDRFWGKFNGDGENNLGLLIMEIRHKLREGEPL